MLFAEDMPIQGKSPLVSYAASRTPSAIAHTKAQRVSPPGDEARHY
jgi:hypothetical protein